MQGDPANGFKSTRLNISTSAARTRSQRAWVICPTKLSTLGYDQGSQGSPVWNTDLLVDVVEMNLYGSFTQVELSSDLSAGIPLRDQRHYLLLTFCQRLQSLLIV